MKACALNNTLCYYTETTPPRKSEEDVTFKFCKSWEGQEQSFADVLQSIKKFRKLHRKTPVFEFLFNKVAGLGCDRLFLT